MSIDTPIMRRIVSMQAGLTKGSQSPMWRCVCHDGERVNVFRHTDPQKNNFALFEQAGYAYEMNLMQDGEEVADREKREDGWWIRYQRDIIHADGRVETEYQWQHKQEHDGGWRELKTNKRTIALFDVLIEAWAKGDEQREARVRLDKISRDLPDLSGGF